MVGERVLPASPRNEAVGRHINLKRKIDEVWDDLTNHRKKCLSLVERNISCFGRFVLRSPFLPFFKQFTFNTGLGGYHQDTIPIFPAHFTPLPSTLCTITHL
jgi:hypothetical protein